MGRRLGGRGCGKVPPPPEMQVGPGEPTTRGSPRGCVPTAQPQQRRQHPAARQGRAWRCPTGGQRGLGGDTRGAGEGVGGRRQGRGATEGSADKGCGRGGTARHGTAARSHTGANGAQVGAPGRLGATCRGGEAAPLPPSLITSAAPAPAGCQGWGCALFVRLLFRAADVLGG